MDFEPTTPYSYKGRSCHYDRVHWQHAKFILTFFISLKAKQHTCVRATKFSLYAALWTYWLWYWLIIYDIVLVWDSYLFYLYTEMLVCPFPLSLVLIFSIPFFNCSLLYRDNTYSIWQCCAYLFLIYFFSSQQRRTLSWL